MKLRIRGNSIRLRLLRNEVEDLVATGSVSESVRFGARDTDVFTYSIAASEDTMEIVACFVNREFIVLLPAYAAIKWKENDAVSLEASQIVGENGDALKILIEKDFVCPGREYDPDNENAFPHPKSDCR